MVTGTFLNGTLHILYNRFRTIVAGCHSDYKRTQLQATEVKYLKYQPE
jgi:hypothetical protein